MWLHCDNRFPSLVASLFWRCLAASTSSFLHAAMNLRPPSVTVSTHTSAFKAVAFQSPAMPNARMSLWMQSVYSFSFPPRPLRTAPSRFPKTIRFGSRPPLIRRSVSAHRSPLVRNVVPMLSHPVISRARLYEVCMYIYGHHIQQIMDQPGKVANPARGQLNRENNIPLSPYVPENLASRDEFSRPVPRQPAHLHTQAESGAYSRDSSRVPRRRPFMKPPYVIGSVPSLSGQYILLFLTFSVLVTNPKKSTLHGGQSRS